MLDGGGQPSMVEGSPWCCVLPLGGGHNAEDGTRSVSGHHAFLLYFFGRELLPEDSWPRIPGRGLLTEDS